MASHGDPADSPGHIVAIDGRRPSEALIAAIATLSETEIASLPPLYEIVDPEALDMLYEHVRERTDEDLDAYQIMFPYQGYDVCVEFDGRIRLETS